MGKQPPGHNPSAAWSPPSSGLIRFWLHPSLFLGHKDAVVAGGGSDHYESWICTSLPNSTISEVLFLSLKLAVVGVFTPEELANVKASPLAPPRASC